jgi:glycosyltransferase involved in cell wall biosynthesis
MLPPLRVLELLVSTELGGGPAHVRDLIARLPRDEFELTVGAPAGGPYTRVFRELGASVVDLPCDRVAPASLGRVVRLIRERGFHLVHSHGKGAGVYGRLAARRAGIPAIHTFHGIHYRRYPIGLRSAYLALERWLIGATWAVVHVSESQAREAGAVGLAPEGRTHVIVNGIDVERVACVTRARPLSREALGLARDALVVGAVARFDPVKGLDVLLDAFARARRLVPEASLLLIGDGEGGRRLRAQAARLGVEDRVVFAGAIEDAVRCLPAVDLFVSASHGEGLPLSMLEAMACGLPVVATRVPGHVDAVEDAVTGLLVPPAPGVLGDAVALLARDPARRAAMGAAGRKRVERLFTAGRMAAEVAALYRRAGTGSSRMGRRGR